MEIFTKDFVEFIKCCAAREVKFLIVGGYALAAHGHPRATKDLDIWILIEENNAERIVGALDDFGMGSVGLEPADFLEPEMVIQLGYPPYRIRSHHLSQRRRLQVLLGSPTHDHGRQCGGWPHLLRRPYPANKRASGRPQDIVDADVLAQLRPEE